jgi:hypothetical protein
MVHGGGLFGARGGAPTRSIARDLPRFAGEVRNYGVARTRAGGVALPRDGQSAQADFVCLLRRIHSLGSASAPFTEPAARAASTPGI